MSNPYDEFFEEHPEWRKYADLVIMPPTASEAVDEFPELAGSELLKHEFACATEHITRLALYTRALRTGGTHRFAEMVATQRPPRCMTDDVFFAGMPRLGDAMDEQNLQGLVAAARRHGYTPPADAVYHSGLARFRGDPEAFVTRSMGRGYIKRLCEQRGWACEGAVTTKSREPDRDMAAQENCVPMAEDVIRSNAREMVRANPDLARLSRRELRERVLEKHGPTK